MQKRTKNDDEKKGTTDDERNDNGSHAESEGEKNTSIGHGQDSNVSLESDIDDNLIYFIKWSTRDSEGKIRQFNISCWIQTQRKLKWRLPTRIAAHSEEIWTKKSSTMEPKPLFSNKNEQKRGKTEEEM